MRKVLLIIFLILLSLVLYSIVTITHEKTGYILNAEMENQNVSVTWQLDADDQISTIEIALFDKTGQLLPENHFEEYCDTINNCHSELKLKLAKRNIPFIPPNKIILPTELMKKHAIWIGIKTSRYDRYPSYLLFCSSGGNLIREKDISSSDVEDFYKKCQN